MAVRNYSIQQTNTFKLSFEVLKHKTSSQNFISIDLKFGVGNNVREVTSPAKFGSDPMSGRDATWGQHIRVL